MMGFKIQTGIFDSGEVCPCSQRDNRGHPGRPWHITICGTTLLGVEGGVDRLHSLSAAGAATLGVGNSPSDFSFSWPERY